MVSRGSSCGRLCEAGDSRRSACGTRGPVAGEEHRGLFSLLTVRSAEVSGRACKKAKKWSFKLEVGASYGSGRVAEAGYPDSSRG